LNAPAYRWKLVAVLFSVGAVNYADRTAISSVFPLLRSEFNASDVVLAAIGSLFLWTYAVGSPVWGYLADRVSRSRMIFWSLTFWSLITAATALVRSSHELLVARALLGIAESAYLPAAIALIADFHGPKSRGAALGIHVAGLNFGLIAGGAGSGYVGEHFGWRYGFALLGSIGLALAMIAHLVLRDQSGSDRNSDEVRLPSSALQDFRALVRIRTYLIVVVEAMLISIGTWIFFNWLPLYFKETFGMSLALAGFSGTFFLQLAATSGSLFGGFGSDWISRQFRERRLLLMSVCYLLSAPCLLAFLTRQTAPVLSLFLFVYSLIRAIGAANEGPIMCDILQPRLRSSALALLNTANCFAGGAGILIAGYVKPNFGLAGVFSCVSLIVVLCAFISFAGYIFFIRKDLIYEGSDRYSSKVMQAERI
jgi:MFS transporter, Spinster family, sphingosine-1-phosphate transporter